MRTGRGVRGSLDKGLLGDHTVGLADPLQFERADFLPRVLAVVTADPV